MTRQVLVGAALLLSLACANQTPGAPTRVASTTRATSSIAPPTKRATSALTTPVDACDDAKRGRECLKPALQLEYGDAQRTAALTRACKAGYEPGCYFLEHVEGPDARSAYVRRGCAYDMHGACQALSSAIRRKKLDPAAPSEQFGFRWVKQATEPVLESRASVRLLLHPGAKLILLDVEGSTAFALVSQFESKQGYQPDDPLRKNSPAAPPDSDEALVVSLPVSLLSKTELALQVPELRADALDQARKIYATPDAVAGGVDLECGPVEILADLPGRIQELRQLRDGVEVRGFTRIPLEWSWDSNSCEQRLVWPSAEGSAAPVVPAGYVRPSPPAVQRAVGRFQNGQPLYRVVTSDTGLECSKLSFAHGELQIAIHPEEPLVKREITFGVELSKLGLLQLDGPSVREVDKQGKVREWAAGCTSYLSLVGDTPEAIQMIKSWMNPPIAFHPDDVALWYKTEAACQHAIALHPRLRLESGQRGVATAAPLRIIGGC